MFMSDVFCDSSIMTNDNRRGGGTFEDGTFAIYAVLDPSDTVSPDRDHCL